MSLKKTFGDKLFHQICLLNRRLHLEDLSALYEIWAFVNDRLVLFHNDLKANAFLIKRKKY